MSLWRIASGRIQAANGVIGPLDHCHMKLKCAACQLGLLAYQRSKCEICCTPMKHQRCRLKSCTVVNNWAFVHVQLLTFSQNLMQYGIRRTYVSVLF